MSYITYSLAPFGEPQPPPSKPVAVHLRDAAELCKKCIAKMSNETKSKIETWVAIVGLILALLAASKTYIFMPADLDALKTVAERHDRTLMELQAKATSDRELLITLKVQNEIMQRVHLALAVPLS